MLGFDYSVPCLLLSHPYLFLSSSCSCNQHLGVIVLLALEISFTTPPFGLLLFVMKGVAPPDTKMTEIYMAGIPFILCAIAVVILMVIFPDVALYLPNLVK